MGEGAYLTLGSYRGVWFSDTPPLGVNEGIEGSALVTVETGGADLSEWEMGRGGEALPRVARAG